MKKITIILFISFILIPQAIAKTLVLFSPYDSCDEKIIEYIDSAEKSIDVAIYSFTLDSIKKALIKAKKRGVSVRVIMDARQADNKHSVDEKLEEAGISVIKDTHNGLMHNKFVIFDSKKVITGSYNWTKDAAEENDENIVILDKVGKKYTEYFNSLWKRRGGG